MSRGNHLFGFCKLLVSKLKKLPFRIQQKQTHSLSFANETHVTRRSVKWELHEQWCQSIISQKEKPPINPLLIFI